MLTPALSLDGQRIAVSSTEAGNIDIWVHDLVRAAKPRSTLDEGLERTPTWSPSGEQLIYQDAEEDAPPKIRVVQNWYEEFRDRRQ